MTDKRIDEILGTEEALIPSSGFVSAVMERVREEAAAPPPIPFPWKRALPGFVVAAGVFGWAAVEFARNVEPAIGNLTLPDLKWSAAASIPLEQAGWVLGALAFSAASWVVCRRLAR
jgi:hypothetical protein